MVVELVQATAILGLPVAGLSWLLFKRLYSTGRLDRSADQKSIRSGLKSIKKAAKDPASRDKDFFQNRWMKFGGGFYGVVGLWTFFAIEISDFLSFAWNFPGFAKLLENGLISLVVNALVNQLMNFVSALIWFSYWSGAERNLLVWVAIAYLGYLLGISIARHGYAHWMTRIRELLGRGSSG